jgi:beta-galactosidase
LIERQSAFLVQGRDFQARFDRRDGTLVSYRLDDRQILAEPLQPNFWKAPNDNQYRNNYVKRLGAWRHAAENRKVTSVVAREVGEQIEIVANSVLPVGKSPYVVSYRVQPDGRVSVTCRYEPGSGDLPLIPKFGMTCKVPKGFSNVRWYGRGPQETYWDRKTGGEVAVYELTVEEMIHPYLRPQDNANRTDVRWFTLADKNGCGIKVCGDAPLSFATWPYNVADLEGAMHDYALPRRKTVTVNIDHKLHGVGGDNSWGARTHPEYTLPGNQPYEYSFTITPIKSNDR